MSQLIKAQQQSIAHSDSVTQICQPLFDATSIKNFSSARLYIDTGMIHLATESDWLEFYFLNSAHLCDTLLELPELIHNDVILWNTIDHHEIVRNAKQHFDIDNGITLIDRKPDYFEIFNFGANPDDTHNINWYINNLDVLKNFILCYQEQSDKIIGTIAPSKYEKINNNFDLKQLIERDQKNKIVFEPDHIVVNHRNSEVILNRREYQCVALLLEGMTAKCIGLKLDISSRTVESYLNNVKKKFDIHYKNELIAIMKDVEFPIF